MYPRTSSEDRTDRFIDISAEKCAKVGPYLGGFFWIVSLTLWFGGRALAEAGVKTAEKVFGIRSSTRRKIQVGKFF